MDTPQVIVALAALAQETRLAIFRLLVQAGSEGMAATKISEQLGIAPSSLSFHLKELVHSDLIESRQSGRFIFYSANINVMNAMLGYLTENCCNGESCVPANKLVCEPR